jgi:protein-S-isoprenylcysteine O-methyltransferase Ste14
MLIVKGLIRWFLQSMFFAALVVLPAVVAPLIGRIVVEEATLRKTLPGYPVYMESVRSRLVPGIW